MSTEPIVCTHCGTVLSVNGHGWIKQGYRVSRRNIDGTPIRGTVSRPSLAGTKLCRSCVDIAVERKRTAR